MSNALKFFCVVFLCVTLIPICGAGVQLGLEGVSWLLRRVSNAVIFLAETTISTAQRVWTYAPPWIRQAWEVVKHIFEFIIGMATLLVAIATGAGILYLLYLILMFIFKHIDVLLEFLPFLLP